MIVAWIVILCLAIVAVVLFVRRGAPAGIPETGTPISSLWAPPLFGLLRNVSHIQEYLHRCYSELPPAQRQPLFRISLGGYNAIVAVDPVATREILCSDNKNFVKDTSFIVTPVRILTQSGLILVSGDQWKRQRKTMDPKFTPASLKQFVPMMQDKFNELFSAWDSRMVGNTIELNAAEWASKVSIDILGKLAFSMDFESIKGSNNEFLENYNLLMGAAMNPIYAPLLWKEGIPLPFSRKVWAACRFLDRTATRIAEEKLAKIAEETHSEEKEESFRGDLLDMLVRSHQLSPEELHNNIFTFLAAGSDTTSITISWLMHMLGAHQEEQEKVRQEVLAAFGKEIPTFEGLSKLDYTEKFIRETMRLEPATGFVPTRRCIADTVVGGVVIPSGTLVAFAPYLTHRLPDVYPDPLEFKPERYNAPTELMAKAFLPFSAGPRACIGMKLSLIETKIFVAMLVQRFQVEKVVEVEYGSNPVFRQANKIIVRISKLPPSVTSS